MKCPQCGSEEVTESVIIHYPFTMICNVCGKTGTRGEFGMDLRVDFGIATTHEKAIYEVSQTFHDEKIPKIILTLTIHQIDEKTAGNIWICLREVWIRLFEEKIYPVPPAPHLLHHELLRLVRNTTIALKYADDPHWKKALTDLQQQVITKVNFIPN